MSEDDIVSSVNKTAQKFTPVRKTAKGIYKPQDTDTARRIAGKQFIEKLKWFPTDGLRLLYHFLVFNKISLSKLKSIGVLCLDGSRFPIQNFAEPIRRLRREGWIIKLETLSDSASGKPAKHYVFYGHSDPEKSIVLPPQPP
jgi:hypothetical protein